MRRTSKKQQAPLPFQMNKMIKIGIYQTDPESDFIKRHKEYFNKYSVIVLQSAPGNRFRHFVLPFLINTHTQWQTESGGITIRPDHSSGMKYNYQKGQIVRLTIHQYCSGEQQLIRQIVV